MKRAIISPEAQSDLDDIWEYIAKDNPPAADRLVDELHQQCTELAESPEHGKRRDELGVGLRSWPVRKTYLIFYRLTTDGTEVVRILHGARDLDELF